MTTKTIIIDGYIGPYAYSKQLIRNELAGQSKNPVLVKISSLGGSVDDALSIYDQFIEHGNVTAELSAFVASSATLISLGAKSVRMNENSFYLIHKAMNWVDAWGSMNEDQIESLIAQLEAQKQQLAKITLQLAKMYVRKTGKNLDEIIHLMKQETWLTAEEALEWGFVDEVFAPEVAVNYLDNLQLVAMINGNDLPHPPRKKSAKTPVSELTVEPDEESLFNRIWNQITNRQKEEQINKPSEEVEITKPKNIESMKKQFLNVNKILGVESLESSADGIFINEQQLDQLEDRLAQDQQIVAERNTAISERDTARAELSNVLNPFDAIDPSIASAQTPEAKVLAIRTLLAKKPSVQPAGNHDKSDPVSDGVHWEVINNLPHNKQVDQNS
jgi:ATP-dependent protease ClpP protease subunit